MVKKTQPPFAIQPPTGADVLVPSTGVEEHRTVTQIIADQEREAQTVPANHITELAQEHTPLPSKVDTWTKLGEAPDTASVIPAGGEASRVLQPNEIPSPNVDFLGSYGTFAVAMSPQRLVEKLDEDTVLMVFPKQVLLTLDSREQVIFPPGVHAVPVSLTNHFFLKGNGVTRQTLPPQRELRATQSGQEAPTAPARPKPT